MRSGWQSFAYGKFVVVVKKERHEVVIQGSAMPMTGGIAIDDRMCFKSRRIVRQSIQNAHSDNTT